MNHRTRMKRLTLISSLIVATLASTALLARAQYTAYDLGPGHAFGINDAGTVVGDSDTTGHAFSYSGGVMTDLGTLAYYSFASGINSAGTIVGWSQNYGNGTCFASSYSNGHITLIGNLGGEGSGALAINSAGTIVGWSYPSDSYTYHAFSYSGGVMADLGSLSGGQSKASGINTSGTIVGESYTSGQTMHAFSYSNGHMTDLGTLGGTGESWAFGINSAGTIAGYSSTTAGAVHAFSYSNGHMTDLGTLGGTHSEAYGINDAGAIVGDSTTSAAQHAFSYSGGIMTDLEPFLASIGMTGTSTAEAIDANGDIVGYGTMANGSTHAFLLVEVPEPSSIALGLCGAAALMIARRRTQSALSIIGRSLHRLRLNRSDHRLARSQLNKPQPKVHPFRSAPG